MQAGKVGHGPRTTHRRIGVVGVAALVFVLLLATPAFAQQYEFVGRFGTSGSGDGQFTIPVGVGISPSTGDVYVIDAASNKLQVFDTNGNFKFTFGTLFANPQGVAVSPDTGDVYVADYGNSRVQIFDANGNFKAAWGSLGMGDGQFFNGPVGVAVAGSTGDVYASQIDASRIQIFDASGLYKGDFGSTGSGDGQFTNAPGALAVGPTGDVYASGYFETRVQVFDSMGQYKSQFGTPGSADGQIRWGAPSLAVSQASGDVFVVDTGNARVQIFSADGQFKDKFGSYGSGPGQFLYAMGVGISPTNDYAYVADTDQCAVSIFKPVADVTPPVVTPAVSGPAGDNGWYTGEVTVSCDADDGAGGSGVKSIEYSENGGDWQAYTAPITLSDDGTTSLAFRATDNAGNVSDPQSVTVKIDSSAPAVDIVTPADGATYTLGQTVDADWSAADDVSGLASSNGTVESGQPIDTGSTGDKTFTVTAKDNAGNTAMKTVHYTVTEPGYTFGGILPPIDPDGTRVFKLGSQIPVKFRLTDTSGAYCDDAVANLTIAKIENGVPGPEIDASTMVRATTDNLFRYDTTAEAYVFNWSTKGLTKGTWLLRIHLDDGTVHEVQLSLR